MDAGRKELEETRDNRNDNHDTLYGPQMFNITFSGVGYYKVGYLENGVPRLSEPVAVPLNSRTRAPVVMRAGFFYDRARDAVRGSRGRTMFLRNWPE